MKTIEERAKFALAEYTKDDIPWYDEYEDGITIGKKIGFKDGYIQGATEQKEIDAHEIDFMSKRIAELESFTEKATKLIEAEKAFREHLEDENEKLIDKACLVYEKELRQMKRILNEVKDGAGELICISGSLIQFRKAMEE